MPKLITTKDFIVRAKHKHGERYDYSLVVYKSMLEKVIFICPIHGDFSQTPDNHLRSNGCKFCAYEFTRYGKTRHTTKKFIEKSKKIHGNKYDYSKVDYVNDSTKVSINCFEHGIFNMTPSAHLQGWGCSRCSDKKRGGRGGGRKTKYTTEEFIDLCKRTRGEEYNYSQTKYINSKTDITVICLTHGIFKQHPRVHLEGGLCPQCRPRGYSISSIAWLNTIAIEQNIHIQHAENDGEYQLPELNLFVDGFCKETNTVYEFYGDIFHGNPNLFSLSERCGPSEKTAGELLNQTIKREKQIKKEGYNIITIWENDWNEKQKETNQSRSIHRHSFWPQGKLNTS